jgi:hypothetical protein
MTAPKVIKFSPSAGLAATKHWVIIMQPCEAKQPVAQDAAELDGAARALREFYDGVEQEINSSLSRPLDEILRARQENRAHRPENIVGEPQTMATKRLGDQMRQELVHDVLSVDLVKFRQQRRLSELKKG